MTKSALWQQSATYPAQLDRQLLASIWPTPGLVTGMAVTTPGTSRVVSIAPGSFVVPLGSPLGSALAYSDAIETATFAAAPGAGSSRIDSLIVQIHDPALDAGSTTGFTFDIVLGTASATPSPPVTPARAAVLAQVTSVGGQTNLVQANIAAAAGAHTSDYFAPYVPPAVQDYLIAALSGGPGVGNAVNPVPGSLIASNGGITYDGNAMHVTRAGLYLLICDLTLNNSAHAGQTGYWQLVTYLNGSAITQFASLNTNGFNAAYPTINFSTLWPFNAGDAVSPGTFGSGMANAASINGGLFEMFWLRS